MLINLMVTLRIENVVMLLVWLFLEVRVKRIGVTAVVSLLLFLLYLLNLLVIKEECELLTFFLLLLVSLTI